MSTTLVQSICCAWAERSKHTAANYLKTNGAKRRDEQSGEEKRKERKKMKRSYPSGAEKRRKKNEGRKLLSKLPKMTEFGFFTAAAASSSSSNLPQTAENSAASLAPVKAKVCKF